MLVVMGSNLCPFCRECVEKYTAAGIDFEFCDINESLMNLKNFLKIRDSSPLFEEQRAKGKIGIPCILEEDGNVSLDWRSYLPQ